eukprot:EC096705.1.p1 GENE.EC096705.1~~EC096705.1.p1  ORF type:complete len:157 (-),score=4.79 EC096705.1:148-618(-)
MSSFLDKTKILVISDKNTFLPCTFVIMYVKLKKKHIYTIQLTLTSIIQTSSPTIKKLAPQHSNVQIYFVVKIINHISYTQLFCNQNYKTTYRIHKKNIKHINLQKYSLHSTPFDIEIYTQNFMRILEKWTKFHKKYLHLQSQLVSLTLNCVRDLQP